MRRKHIISLGAILTILAGTAACGGNSSSNSVLFLVKITNIGADAIPNSTGSNAPAVFAPGAAAVHSSSAAPFFTTGQSASSGLEVMAEDGGGTMLAEEASAVAGVSSTVTFGVPDGAADPGPLTPGNSYSFQVEGRPGDRLSLATMFVQSNDLFVAPAPDGIPLFEGEAPRAGDVTAEMPLWDAGTEVNEEPGTGPNQAPRQAGPDTGVDENGVVRLLNENDFPLPPLSDVVTITIEPVG